MISDGEDIILRASIGNDTEAGAAAVKKSVKKLNEDVLAENKSFEQQVKERVEQSKREYEAVFGKGKGGDGGEGHNPFARALRDQKTTGIGATNRGIIDTLDEMFPKLKIAAGAGLVGIAGGMLNELATKTSEAADHLRDGKSNAADLMLEIGKGIPIIGNFVSAGEQINNIITGQKQNLDAVNQTTESIVRLYDTWGTMARRVAQEDRDHARDLAKDDREIAAIGLRGIDAERQALANKYADQRAANQKAREEAKTAALEEAKPALDAKKQFEAAFGGMNMSTRVTGTKEWGPLNNILKAVGLNVDGTESVGEVKDKLDAIVSKIQQTANQHRDSKISFLDADDAKRVQEEVKALGERNKLYLEGLQIQQQSHEAEMARAKASTEAQGLGTEGFGIEARQKAIEAQAAAARDQARIEALQRSHATTNAEELDKIDSQLADKLVAIEKQKNADLAAAQKEAALTARQFQFKAAESQADAAESERQAALKLQGRTFEAGMDSLKHNHDKRQREIEQQRDIDIARDKDHEKEIRENAAGMLRSNDADFKSHRIDEIRGAMSAATSRDPLTNFADAGRTSGRAAAFRASFQDSQADKVAKAINQPIIDAIINVLPTKIANAVNGGSPAGHAPALPLHRFG